LDLNRLRQLALNDSGFVFDPLSGHTFTVNETGLAVIKALKEGLATEQIIESLGADFELEGSEDLSRDVDDFLARLREQGLVG
jgi:PqqD family protein of HPr-rel-A system